MKHALYLTALAGALMMPAVAGAQETTREDHFDGPYVSIFGARTSQANDGDETLVFDTNRDGEFGENVVTTTGANAFAPGFCGGAATGTANADCGGDRDGWEYGARLGFDRRMGNIVIGALVEGSRSEARDGVSGFSTTPASYTFTREADYTIGARLRAGYTPNGGILFYATGGGAYARMDNRFSTNNTANSFADNGKTNAWGWSAGGGAEAMLTDNVSLGLEYLFTDLDDDDYRVDVGAGTAPATNPFLLNGGGTTIGRGDSHFRNHSFRASLNFRF
jgi:outer membrane immunogenic protein